MIIYRKGLWYNLFIFPFSDSMEWRVDNFCQYFWAIVRNVLLWFVLLPCIAGGMLAVIIVQFIIPYPWISLGYVIVAVGFIYFLDWCDDLRHKKPGFIRTAWTSFKDKHCKLISFED